MSMATFVTNQGSFTVRLMPEHAPDTVRNFVDLATGSKEWTDPRDGQPKTEALYSGTIFHRVIPNFMVQGGDPLSRDPNHPRVGTGGPGYTIKCETEKNTHKHVAGTLSMAHAGKNTGGSQFFICHSPQGHLDRVHTVFGQVTTGLDIVNAIQKNDVIESIRVA